MRNKRLMGVLLSCLMLSIPMAGCASDIETILGESWGVPGGLALACLRDDAYRELVIEMIMHLATTLSHRLSAC